MDRTWDFNGKIMTRLFEFLDELVTSCTKSDFRDAIEESLSLYNGKALHVQIEFEELRHCEYVGYQVHGKLSPPYAKLVDGRKYIVDTVNVSFPPAEAAEKWTHIMKGKLVSFYACLAQGPLPAINIIPFGDTKRLIIPLLQSPKTGQASTDVEQFDETLKKTLSLGGDTVFSPTKLEWENRDLKEFKHCVCSIVSDVGTAEIQGFFAKLLYETRSLKGREVERVEFDFAFDVGELSAFLKVSNARGTLISLSSQGDWVEFVHLISENHYEEKIGESLFNNLQCSVGKELADSLTALGCRAFRCK